MLLESLLINLHTEYDRLQALIDSLQAKQREVQADIQAVGVRESRMESCLALLQEVVRESQGHPQELEIFRSAVDAAFLSEAIALLPPQEESGQEEVAPESPVEPEPQPPTPADLQDFAATYGELLTLPLGCLQEVAESKGVDATGSKSDLVVRLNKCVSASEFQELAALTQEGKWEPDVEAIPAPAIDVPSVKVEAREQEEKAPQVPSRFASEDELMSLKAGQLRSLARKHALPSANGTKKDLAQALHKHVTLKELHQAIAA